LDEAAEKAGLQDAAIVARIYTGFKCVKLASIFKFGSCGNFERT
jgi:hypothetical protein